MALEEQAIKVLDESASDADSKLVDQLVEEFPALAGSLVKTINRRNNTNLEIPKKERVSKNKILLDITSNLSKINGELTIINSRLQAQNDLLRANLGFTANSIGNLEYNDSLLTSKLDSVLEALKIQNEFMREKEEDQERDRIESGAEATDPGAFVEGFTKGHKRGSPLGGLLKDLLGDRIRNFLTKRILKFFTKRGMMKFLDKVKGRLGWKTARRGWEHIALNPKQAKFAKPRWWQAIGDRIKPITRPLTSKLDDIANSSWGKGLIGILDKPGKWLKSTKLGGILSNIPWTKIGTRLSKRMPLITARFSGKMVPGFGAGVSFLEAAERASKGDSFGAWLATIGGTADTASMFTSPATVTGVGAAIPGGLQAISMGADITLLLYDIIRAFSTPLEEHEMEHGGVIQAPPILTPAEKGAVIGGNGHSDIGHIVNAASMITDTFKVNLSGVNRLRNQFPVDGSTGIVTLTPLTGIEPVIENDVKPDGLQLEDDDSTSDNNNNAEISEEPIDYHERKGDVLLSSNDIKIDNVDAASNNFNISSITPITQTNNISNDISHDVDPVGKTKIIFVTKTNVVSGGGNNIISGGGGNTFNIKVYPTHHKLSRLILAS